MRAVLGTAMFLHLCQAPAKTPDILAENILRRQYSEAVQISRIAVPITPAVRESLQTRFRQSYADDTVHALRAETAEKTLGYAIVDDVKGKDQLITYCVVVDDHFVVKEVSILFYREPYGGEVQNKSWLKQFFGKRAIDELRPGKEVKNITGATISSRAITLGVKRILMLLRFLESRLNAAAAR